MVIYMEYIRKIYRKIRHKKEIKNSSDLKEAVQDIFAHFLQRMHDDHVGNYLSVKDFIYDYTEIIMIFFEGKNEKLLKKLTFAMFVPFLYAELTAKERVSSEKHVLDLHKRLEKLYIELQLGKKPIVDFRKPYLPKDENTKKEVS